MQKTRTSAIVLLAALITFAGCSKTATPSSQNSANPSSSSTAPAATQDTSAATPQPAAPVVIPAGKTLDVTIDQEVSTKTSNEGDHFDASLAEPVTIDGNDVLPKGARVRGVVETSAQAGHIKGGAVLTVALDSISVNGQSYRIKTSSYTEQGKTRGKRTAIGAGGGAAFGAIVGALAGGGKGAAIGAAAGGGAGTAGAAVTGNRDVTIPAETRVRFRLTQPVSLSQ